MRRFPAAHPSVVEAQEVKAFPVRHHSPAAALHLARLIRERRPRAIVIEGPADADPLIPYLLDPASEPQLKDIGDGHYVACHFPLSTAAAD